MNIINIADESGLRLRINVEQIALCRESGPHSISLTMSSGDVLEIPMSVDEFDFEMSAIFNQGEDEYENKKTSQEFR